MPLDQQAKAIQAILQDEGWTRLPEMTPAQARRALARFRSLAGDPEPVAGVEDLAVPTDEGAVRVRLYRPHGVEQPPVLVYFHGGGFVLGGIESSDGVCRALTNRAGCVTVSVDYRLAPEHRFPAAVRDAYAVTSWLARHGHALGVDSHRMGVAGNSAGGNLATVVAMTARDRGGPVLVSQLLTFPLVDLSYRQASIERNGEGYVLTRSELEWYRSHYLGDPAQAADPRASPLAAGELAGLPPAILVLAEFDPLVDQGVTYAERLVAAGVQVELLEYAGMMHSFLSMSGVLRKAGQGLDEVGAHLARALRAPPEET